jgi:hypothetical protein
VGKNLHNPPDLPNFSHKKCGSGFTLEYPCWAGWGGLQGIIYKNYRVPHINLNLITQNISHESSPSVFSHASHLPLFLRLSHLPLPNSLFPSRVTRPSLAISLCPTPTRVHPIFLPRFRKHRMSFTLCHLTSLPPLGHGKKPDQPTKPHRPAWI